MQELEIPLDQILKDPYQAGREYRRLGIQLGHLITIHFENVNTRALTERQKRIGRYATLNYCNDQWEMFRTGMNTM